MVLTNTFRGSGKPGRPRNTQYDVFCLLGGPQGVGHWLGTMRLPASYIRPQDSH